tara:strand:+ start:203 stop:394 length:192 start_codon:yes stop_codon:yes gene_type:complete
MENGIIQVHLIDGGIFRVLFENKNQKNRILLSLKENTKKISEWGLLTNGIHSTKDFETIIKNR